MSDTLGALRHADVDPDLLGHVSRCINDIRDGKMIILVDDEDRENEGDLVFAADKVTPELVNFMAKYGRGLICVTLTEAQVERLELPMMTLPQWRGGPPLGTAFTLSIEASSGVTTGISAADRSHTIAVAASPTASPRDIVCPGHIFPLRARNGGVLVRAGQTEGSVDLARLAGLHPAGVICEIMKDDGTMARMPDLEVFAREHDMRILTIADLIQFRLRTELLVERVHQSRVRLQETGHDWDAIVFRTPDDVEVLALVYGTPTDSALCRMHRAQPLSDALSSTGLKQSPSPRLALQRIEEEGCGVLVYLPGHSHSSLTAQLETLRADASGPDASEADTHEHCIREYGLGAQVLRALGLARIRLLTNNPPRLVGLRGHGLEVLDTVPLQA